MSLLKPRSFGLRSIYKQVTSLRRSPDLYLVFRLLQTDEHMDNFERYAARITAGLTWSIIIIKLFVTLTRWLILATISLWILIETLEKIVKALHACHLKHRFASWQGGVLRYETTT